MGMGCFKIRLKFQVDGEGIAIMGRRKKSDIVWDNQNVIPTYFQKDNNLISSKSRMTLLGRKVFDIAIMHVEEGYDEQGMPEIHSIINGQELKEFMNRKSNSLYEQVKDLIDPKPSRGKEATKPSLLDWRIIVKDNSTQFIDAINVIAGATFKNGKLKIVFNNALKSNLIGYKKNYTLLDKEIISKFHSNYSYQLYQIFKKTIDRERAIKKIDGLFEMEVDLADLKVQLGIVEANENDILYEAVIDDTINTYDEINKIAKSGKKEDIDLVKRLKEYGNFRITGLEPAKKEINELSDIEMDFKPVKRGLGGDTVAVKFYIKYKDVISNSSVTPLEEAEKVDLFEFIDEIRDMLQDIKLSSKDIKSISEAAGYNKEKIKKAYEAMMASGSEIGNPTGFMIQAIKEGYEPPTKLKKSQKSAWSGQFEQREIDFDELENKLLDN